MKINICKYLFSLFVSLSLFSVQLTAQTNFRSQRESMVQNQIEARGITDIRLLNAFRTVERHKFVLPEYVRYAYSDTPLPIIEGQTISQPFIVAFMTDALGLDSSEKVLEIGTGSGYQAAILSQICDSVFTVEIFETLGQNARALFAALGYKNVFCKIGDGYVGWEEHAPFDAIIVTCSPTHIPEPLKNQLAEGGRMIIPVGKDPIQNLVLLKKKRGKIREESVLPVRFVPMLKEDGRKY
jgi:protein-L-isoaspartate(D-aspartate) O-methyltransferase